jgi:hypothetical protein
VVREVLMLEGLVVGMPGVMVVGQMVVGQMVEALRELLVMVVVIVVELVGKQQVGLVVGLQG